MNDVNKVSRKKEWRLLQRAVFVLDRNDCIVYAEYVTDQLREPD